MGEWPKARSQQPTAPLLFRFRQFSVQQQQAAMKVGTDSVLLGCFADASGASRILDIGAGTGLLSLMLAQKGEALIDAVEVDEATCTEAGENFGNSIWKDRLRIFHADIDSYKAEFAYDLIISNPPYFSREHNYHISDSQRSIARQHHDLTPDILCRAVRRDLSADGTFWLVLPVKESTAFDEVAAQYSLFPMEVIAVRPKESKPVNRIITCFSRIQRAPLQKQLTIYNEDGSYTDAYYQLTKPYLLWEKR